MNHDTVKMTAHKTLTGAEQSFPLMVLKKLDTHQHLKTQINSKCFDFGTTPDVPKGHSDSILETYGVPRDSTMVGCMKGRSIPTHCRAGPAPKPSFQIMEQRHVQL